VVLLLGTGAIYSFDVLGIRATPDPIDANGAASQASGPVASRPVLAADVVSAPSPPSEIAGDLPGDRVDVATQHKLARILGRCVNEVGAPLAGCRVRVTILTANAKTMEEWVREHGAEPAVVPPAEFMTTSDGRFAMEFWPPPPSQVVLDVSKDGLAGAQARWHRLAEGSRIDLGDVELRNGVRVRGRVVDLEGQPKADVGLFLQPRQFRPRPPGIVAAASVSSATSGSDGRFEFEALIEPGAFEFGSVSAILHSPKLITLTTQRPIEDVAVVVSTVRNAVTIRGRVVDEQGRGVAGVDVVSEEPKLGNPQARTDAEGNFELIRPGAGPTEDAPLMVLSLTHRLPGDQHRVVRWGSDGVIVTVMTGATLTIEVRESDGTGVEDYSVRLFSRRTQARLPTEIQPRSKGPHADGVSEVAGLLPGDWRVILEFPLRVGSALVTRDLHQEGNVPQRLVVTLPERAARELRVQSADGRSVVGSNVQLCDLLGQPLTPSRKCANVKQSFWLSHEEPALVVAEGVTDTSGRFVLHGFARQDYGLAIRGPTHLEHRSEGLRLDVAAPLVVTVNAGARVFGRVVPVEAVHELKRLTGAGPRDPFDVKRVPIVDLLDAVSRRHANPGDDPVSRFARRVNDDGTYQIRGLEPGTYAMTVSAWLGGLNGTATTRNFQAGELIVPAEGTIEHDLDLSDIIPGIVEATLMHQGAPLRDTRVLLLKDSEQSVAVSDTAGRISTPLVPGNYEVRWVIAGGTHWFTIRSADRLEVRVGPNPPCTISFRTSDLLVRLLDADGNPSRGVRVGVRGELNGSFNTSMTDGKGEARLQVATESLRLWALPRRYNDPSALALAVAASGSRTAGNPFGNLPVEIGTLDPVPGGNHALELRLPADWER
jgi:hypothetical protein